MIAEVSSLVLSVVIGVFVVGAVSVAVGWVADKRNHHDADATTRRRLLEELRRQP